MNNGDIIPRKAPEINKYILEYLIDKNYTYKQIAKKFGVTYSQIDYAIRKNKLRRFMKNKNIWIKSLDKDKNDK